MPDTDNPHLSSRRLQPALKRLLGLSLSLLAGCSPLAEPGALVSAPAAHSAAKPETAKPETLIMLENPASTQSTQSEQSAAAPKLNSQISTPGTQTLTMSALAPQSASFAPAHQSGDSYSSRQNASDDSRDSTSQQVSRPLDDQASQLAPESAEAPATETTSSQDNGTADEDSLSHLEAMVSGDPIKLVSDEILPGSKGDRDEILPGSKGDRNGILPGSKGDRIPLTSLDVEVRLPATESFSVAQADAPETQDWQVSLDGAAPARVLLLGSQTSNGEQRIWLRLESIDFAEEVSLHELTISNAEGVLQSAGLVAALSSESSQVAAPFTSTSLAEWMVALELQQDQPVQAIEPAMLAAIQADPETAELAAGIAALQLESKGSADPSKTLKLKGKANAIAHRLLNHGKGSTENNGGGNNASAENNGGSNNANTENNGGSNNASAENNGGSNNANTENKGNGNSASPENNGGSNNANAENSTDTSSSTTDSNADTNNANTENNGGSNNANTENNGGSNNANTENNGGSNNANTENSGGSKNGNAANNGNANSGGNKNGNNGKVK